MTSTADRAAEKVRVLLDLDRNEDAAQAARVGLQSDPNNAELLGLLAFALQADGHARDARMWAQRSLAMNPRQAQVLDTRARAILDGAGEPQEAVESAYAATQIAPTNPFYRFTLTQAYLEVKQRKNARSTAQSIRAVAPASSVGPLAEALVEIDRARFFQVRPWWAVFAVLVTRGVALLVYALAWLIFYLQRRGPLRRADALLLEALRLDPGDAGMHAVAAEVARYRFRFIRAVDSSLAAAAIDGGMVDANELARGIVRRTSVLVAVTFVFWCIFLLPVLTAIAAPVMAAIFGAALAIIAAASVAWIYREQTVRLPPGALRLVHRRWELPGTVFVIGAGVLAYGLAALNQPGIAIPAFTGAALLLAAAGVLTAKLVSARRIG